MKKLLLILMLSLSSIMVIEQVEAETPVNMIYIHYFRYAGDYSQWNLWGWQSQPEGLDGTSYDFITDETSDEFNFGGVVATIDVANDFPGIQQLGLIVRKGNWLEKDVDSDRFVTIPANTQNGEFHIYLVEGDTRIGTSLDDLSGPDKSPKFKSAYFTGLKTIYFNATEPLNISNIIVKADGANIDIDSIDVNGFTGIITLNDNMSFSKKYEVSATFSSSGEVNTYSVSFDGIYDTPEFEAAYYYDGELGANVKANKTTFRVWAPVSQSVTLNLYDTGTPAKYGGTDTPIRTIVMTPDVKGTFYYEEDGNLHNTYYTYSVTNGSVTNEVVDPYAKSTGINGLRGLVVDFSQVNPLDFKYNNRPNNIQSNTDAIIYELHVRDLTTHPSWNGLDENRGKFLGLIETGTTYEGAKTGFDHLVELGITHVQLLPIFDFGVVDETKLNDDNYNAFNWGYMPMNFNALEGSYSSNPYDGLVRIREMKQVVTAFGNAGIRLNMDVVYNHTGLTANSNFELIVPGYYYRKNESGTFSNGSGTGNETASERAMMQKFIVDSTVFWTTEYNISGFRFDLMGLHDTETMNMVANTLTSIDPTIMVYGEPWNGGNTPLDPSLMANKTNLVDMPLVGAFNDDIRDGIKGSVFAGEQGGYIQGDFSDKFETKVKYGIVGGIAYPGINGSLLSNQRIWHIEPTKTINYVAAHDNNTLYDKLYLTLEEDGRLDLIPALQKQAYGIILTSQGIPFIHAGDEFLRSKPLANGSGFDHNSYESPDSVNQINWGLKTSEDGSKVYEYIKGLIEIRKNHPSFRMTNADDIIANLSFLYKEKEGVIAYQISNTASKDDYAQILVINNANDKNVRLKLPTGGGWVVIADDKHAGLENLGTFNGGKTVSFAAHSTYILYQDTSISDYSPIPTILMAVSSAVVIAGAILLIILKKRK